MTLASRINDLAALVAKDIKALNNKFAVGTWTDVPAKYLPADFGLSGNTVKIRRTEGYWELFISLKANVTATSWGAGASALPVAWLPDFDVQAVVMGNSGQLGRLWLRQSGQTVYTGTALTASYEPTVYLRIPTTKAIPTTTL